jgi:hypothetical protein
MRKQLFKALNHVLSYLPTALPTGLTEFTAWADSIIELSGKFADIDSMRFVLASSVVHLGSDKAYVPKRHFVKILRKGAANQVASFIFQEIKQKQKLAEETAAKAADGQEKANA